MSAGADLNCWAVVPAAGIGERMRSHIPKQYLPLHGRAVLAHSLAALVAAPRLDGIVVVLREDDPHWPTLALNLPCELLIASGGNDRAGSVWNGLQLLGERLGVDDWVLVHDAVRPCLRPADLARLFRELADDPVGGLLATPVRDTMKRADAAGRVDGTVERRDLWHALTPQMFRYGLLCRALAAALDAKLPVTDEASALELAGYAPRLVEGSADNLKITRPADLPLAEFLLGSGLPAPNLPEAST